ncbi:MAG: hypothetical protein IPL65_14955 [Lewinellaceae bacterium]|nr:hypothetical protein [Lewinellaceae bacterium]
MGSDVSIRGSRETPTEYYIDGKRVASDVAKKPISPKRLEEKLSAPMKPALEKSVVVEDRITDYEEAMWSDDAAATYTPTPGQPAPRAGLLTAGEWNDLHNWNTHWVDLIKDGEIDNFQQIYGFYPKHRYPVMLSNELDIPLVDIPVTLYDEKAMHCGLPVPTTTARLNFGPDFLTKMQPWAAWKPRQK